MQAEPVDPRTAHEMTRAGDVVIDVRSPEEYAAGHVAGALNVPVDRLLSTTLPDGPLITTCTLGGRASRAAATLAASGRSVVWIEGGTKAWSAAGLPTRTGPVA